MEFEEEIKVDAQSFDNIMLNALREPFRKSIEKALDVMYNKARANLTSSVRASSEMLGGIVKEVSDDAMHGRLRIRPTTTANYKTSPAHKTDYRLMFFNDGTRPRYINVKGARTKRASKMESMFASGMKKGYRGKIAPTDFFNNAVNSTKSRAEKIIDDSIEREIKDRFNKK